MTSRNWLLAVVLSTSVLAGCGGDDPGEGSAQSEASGAVESLPGCDEVWVAGETLPEDYDGCVIQGNEIAVFSPGECPSGDQYATYDDTFYAVVGATIEESASGDIFSDPKFQKFTESC